MVLLGLATLGTESVASAEQKQASIHTILVNIIRSRLSDGVEPQGFLDRALSLVWVRLLGLSGSGSILDHLDLFLPLSGGSGGGSMRAGM
jgi:hypothetical protein